MSSGRFCLPPTPPRSARRMGRYMWRAAAWKIAVFFFLGTTGTKAQARRGDPGASTAANHADGRYGARHGSCVLRLNGRHCAVPSAILRVCIFFSGDGNRGFRGDAGSGECVCRAFSVPGCPRSPRDLAWRAAGGRVDSTALPSLSSSGQVGKECLALSIQAVALFFRLIFYRQIAFREPLT